MTDLNYIGETGRRFIFKVEHKGKHIGYAALIKADTDDVLSLLEDSQVVENRWAFIICPKVSSKSHPEAIKLMAECRDCKPYFKGFYETGVHCDYKYMHWCERQGIEP